MTPDDPRIDAEAGLLYEVAPVAAIFDDVRERITDRTRVEYGYIVDVDDWRSLLRTDSLRLTGDTWEIDARIMEFDRDVDLTYQLDADGDASERVIDYVTATAERRYGVDTDRLRIDTVNMKPGAWFVDATLYPSKV